MRESVTYDFGTHETICFQFYKKSHTPVKTTSAREGAILRIFGGRVMTHVIFVQ